MSSWPPTQPAFPPPGWYTDPSGTNQERRWTGTEWTNDLRPGAPSFPAPTVAPQSFYSAQTAAPTRDSLGTSQHSFGGYVPMSMPQGFDQARASRSSANYGSPNTIGIWFIAVSPALYLGTQYAAFASTTIPGTNSPVLLGLYVVSLVLIILAVVWDSSELRRRNLPAPSVAWMFLSIIAYLIARRIVLKKVGVRHSAPGNVYALVLVASVVSFVFGISSLAEAGAQTQAISSLEKSLEQAVNKASPGAWHATCPADAPVATTGSSFQCQVASASGAPVSITVHVDAPYRFSIANAEGGGFYVK
jgi:hypothetical protein